jgi:hypothetical protein
LELPATIGTNKALTEASAKGWSDRDYAIVSELVRKKRIKSRYAA